ncbi:DUF2950 domain-containing protein [Sinorhizobium meliloti]|nr:DUF2950 family protein [Sinorhizobium meliloti]MCO6420319.1 DUF2950 domain-containing protein [Sinorhizobium meliloti]MDE4580348.1 DUF2950 domain-containing protein [Sinorhizobium meliloti]MDE4604259.1 DUF2950 domain-containing protein [Sinorhizobium meliloti]MDE4617250.1 DUF2950 domain-containing protein [Sinorhizobium meliloti]UDU23446.1 DUF2950 domain-containing protein [Sinorhizobium meliloti]
MPFSAPEGTGLRAPAGKKPPQGRKAPSAGRGKPAASRRRLGLVAWPVRYGVTGVKTFVVNRNGIVYEADLGEDTEKTAAAIRTFNPNDYWAVVQD